MLLKQQLPQIWHLSLYALQMLLWQGVAWDIPV